MMLSLKHVIRSRILVSSILPHYHPLLVPITTSCTCSYASSSSSDSASANPRRPPPFFFLRSIPPAKIAYSFKNWFKIGNNELMDRIYGILGARENENGDELASVRATDSALSQLGLQLDEAFVLEVLAYGKDVLSCLKFFDWAGRQHGFCHTRATFVAIFKILSKAKLVSVMFDFLQTYKKHRFAHKVRFDDILIIGYAVAGKPEFAFYLFGRMRFQGVDLDSVAYHVLLNSLVEKNYFDAFDIVLEQIRFRGHENQITNSIIIKNLCKQNRLDEAEAYLNWLVSNGKVLSGSEVGVLVGALCKNNMFERAGRLVEEFGNSGLVPQENAYGTWIRDLVRAGRFDEALAFFQHKKSSEGYIPTMFRYNILIGRLLKKNRLYELYDLLMEMKENHIPPDTVTMNTVLCFFCKEGKADVALELYNSRSQFGLGLSTNHLAYKYLVLTLCQNGNVDEAYRVLTNSINQGYFLDKTFSVVINALCRLGKVDEMEELLILALERSFMPSASTYDRLISGLRRTGRVEGYLIHGELNNVTTRSSYFKLIVSYCKSNRAESAARLLIEMQEKGLAPTQSLYIVVIHSLLDRDNPEDQFLDLMEILSRDQPNDQIYNIFIQGAGHAKKPQLARKVMEIMQRNGIDPSLASYIYILQSFVRNKRTSDALNFFRDLQRRGIKNRKLYNAFIVDLCKVRKADIALELLSEMKIANLTPSIQCYEVLVQRLCCMKNYYGAINIVNEYEKMGHRLTSFIGNTLLWHSLRAPAVYDACVRLRGVEEEKFSGSSKLSLIIGAYSGRLKLDHPIENWEELIRKCFPLDKYTCKLLSRSLKKNKL